MADIVLNSNTISGFLEDDFNQLKTLINGLFDGKLQNDTYMLIGDNDTDGSLRLAVDTDTQYATIEELTDGIWQPATFLTGPNSLYVGTNVGIAAAGHHIMTEDQDGHYHFFSHSLFSGTLSTSDARIINAYNFEERRILQSDYSGDFTGLSIDFGITATNTTLMRNWCSKTGSTAATQPVRVQAWIGTDDTGIMIFDRYYPASDFPAATVLTSGTLTVDTWYIIDNYVAGDDFTNVGGTNATGVSFKATGTTPTVWTNSSELSDSEIILSIEGYMESEAGSSYFFRMSSTANFSLRANVGVTAPWVAIDAVDFREDDMLQIRSYETRNDGIYSFTKNVDWTIQDKKIYICNITGTQTGTFSSNSALWTVLGSDERANRIQTTGLLEGGVISQASGTTVDWTSGRGQIVDYTDPENPLINDEVTWAAVSGLTPTNLATDGTTLFGYNSSGVLQQKLSTAVTILDAHDIIWFGSATHISSTIVTVITSPGNLAYDGIGSFSDFMNLVIGPANVDGNVYGANGTNMNIDVLGGNAYMLGSNFRINPKLSDIITLANDTTVSFNKVYRSAGAGLNVEYDGVPTTTIDPSSYDDGSGTLQSTTTDYWTIQRVFRNRNGSTYVAYGQQEFATKSAALAVLGSESFIEKSPLPFALFRCSLVVQEGATDLSDTAEAEFYVASAFRIGGVQSSSATIPGVTSPGGIDGDIQFNDSNTFGGNTKLRFFTTTDVTNVSIQSGSATGQANLILRDNTTANKAWIRYDQDLDVLRSITSSGVDIELTPGAGGRVGVGISAPISCFHIYENNASTDNTVGLTIENDGAGDVLAQFLTSGVQRWSMGIDNSDDDKFKIATGTGFDTAEVAITIDPSNNHVAIGAIGTNDPNQLLTVYYDHATTPSVALIQQAGAGDTQLEWLVPGRRWTAGIDNSDSDKWMLSPSNGLADSIVTVETGGNVGINILSPTTGLHVYENDTATDDTTGIKIEQDGAGDAALHFLITGGDNWSMGIDNSDAERFKLAPNTDVGSSSTIDCSSTDINFLSGRTNLANTSTTTFLTMNSPTATGLTGILFHDNLVSLHGSVAYNHNVDQLQFNSVFGDIVMFAGNGLTEIDSGSATQNYIKMSTTGASSTTGFQVENSSVIDLEMVYDQSADKSYIINRSANGLEIESTDGPVRLKTTDDDIILDLVANTGRIEIVGTAHTDSHEIINIATSDGNTDIYVGEDTPVGNVSATGGSIYFRDAEADSGIFMKRSAGAASTAGWTEAGDVNGIVSSVDNALVTFDGTTGKIIQQSSGITAITTVAVADMVFTSPSATGGVAIEFYDSGSVSKFSIIHNDNTDENKIVSDTELDIQVIGAGLNITTGDDIVISANSGANLVTINSDFVFSNITTNAILAIECPSATATAGIKFENNAGVDKVQFAYDQNTDVAELELNDEVPLLIIGNDHADTDILMSLDTDGTNGAHVDIYTGNRTPVGNVTANPGSEYRRVGGTDSAIYLHVGASADNTSWEKLHDSSSGVAGPATSVVNSIAIFDVTDGSSIDDFDQITVSSSSDDRFLNIDMAVEFDGEVGLRIRNELGVDKTTLTYEGNNEETYFNTYGSGGLIATIDGGDSVFQMSSAAANFKINGTASPDTSDIFSLVSGGANGGSSNFLVGTRNPEGNANKAFGHFYVRTDGVNTGMYAKKSVGVSTTDWYPFPTAPQTTVANAVAVFDGTDGSSINSVDKVLITSDATDATIDLNSDLLLTTTASESAVTILSPSGTGDAKIALENNVGSETFAIRYLQNSDVVQVQTNKNTTFSNSIASGTFTFSHGVTGQTILETTGANTNAPISLKTLGTNGATSNIFVSDETPQGNITAVNVGDLCIRADGADSLLYMATDATSADWYYFPKIFEGADRTLSIPSGSGSGSASVILSNSSGTAKGTFAFDQTLDQVSLEVDAVSLDLTSTGLLTLESGSDVVRIRRDEISTAGPAIQFENDTVASRMFLLDVNPQGVTTASPADFAIFEDSTDSGMFIHEGFQGSNDDWHKVVTSPSDGMIGTVYGGLGQYQNYLKYSEDIDNAAWVKEVAVTVTPNNIVSPNGQTTTDTVAWSSSSLGISQVVSLATATTYTLTFWGSNVSGNPILTFDLGSTNKNITLDSTLRKYTLRLVTGAGPTHTLSVSKPVAVGSFGLFGFNLSLGTDELPYAHTLDTEISTLSYGGIINGPLRVQDSTAGFGIRADTQTPVGNLTGNPGDLHVEVNGVDSAVYLHKGASANNTDWKEVLTVDERTLVYNVDVDGIDENEFILIGEYRVVVTGRTGDYATSFACNNQHAAIEVNSLTGSGIVTFTGVSMSESSGIPTATTETITVDATGKYQTDKKWLEITNIDIPVGITAINYDVEVLGYLDMQNSDFTITGMRIDGLSSGNDADFSLHIIKVQDDGSKKCSLVDVERYGYDAKDDLIVDDLRTGGDDRSYTATTSIWANGTNACLKASDYSTYFTSDENIIEGSSKAEGIIIHFNGTDDGNLKQVQTLNLHLTIEMN